MDGEGGLPPAPARLISSEGGTVMCAPSNGVAWEASLDQARQRARQEGRAVLLDFTAAPM
jgi:hypothetical protein